MNPLSLIFFSWLSHSVNGRVHGPSEEVIGEVEQLGLSNLGVSNNGGGLDPFQWRGSYEKCRKKLVTVAGIFCGNFYVGRRQYPPC